MHIHGYATVTAAPAFKKEKGAANVDWFCIPPEKRIVDDSILSWVAGFEEAVSTEFFDYEKA